MLKNTYKSTHHWVKTKDGCKLDCMFFLQTAHKEEPFSDDEATEEQLEQREKELQLLRPCFIVCHSNAMIYQQMNFLSHRFYLKIFLESGINVFTWNYRSYGRTRGTATPMNLKSDIETIYDYLRNTIGIKGKIGIYGRSLGGIPAAYMSDRLQMAIVDRTFGNLSDVATYKFRSKMAAKLLKFGSCGWQTQSDYYLIRQHIQQNELVD